ncbi:hypothetical protein [Streptomyces sp. DH37]|uniref:hypothetical protein n=1 Tax=Streptomyces sp. DH37 TaxID=3040122 RepID=UPI0024415F20|nr:hypothetical protein [Streptomyces sp. DH37]MDG9703792.1 hypothetical protein [Streptomyces sp. DH37]
MPKIMTSAKQLGTYRRELLEEGVPPALADQLVLKAAEHMHNRARLITQHNDSAGPVDKPTTD